MKNSATDTGVTKLLCYLGIFVLLLFIVLPPLFRFLFPVEETKEEPKKLIMNLYCTKQEDFVEYKLKTTINTNYVDGNINDSVFTYEIEIVDEMLLEEGIEIEEYESLKRVNNIDFEEDDNKYIIKIDYSKFNYTNEPLLENHRKVINDQMYTYSENNFECKTTRVQ